MKTARTYALNDKKIVNAWALFDWANSAYALTIAVAVFPNYYESITEGTTYFGDLNITNTALYTFAISFSYLLVSILSPWLSGIADYGGKKMSFMRFFTTMGSICCIALFFFKSTDDIVLGIGATILASVGFAGSLVFYNSYLPEIVTEDQMDRVSAKGFSYGYAGSVILLAINLVFILKPELFGIDTSNNVHVRLAFIMVGVWWFGFALIPFARLPQDPKDKPQANLMSKGFEKIRSIWGEIKTYPNIKRFLSAFFFYSAGVQTIILLASLFASAELGFETAELIGIILLLQLVAIGGAYLFAKVSDKKGNKFSLIVMLVIWIGICIAAYVVTGDKPFYFIAAAVGMVMGGIQSLSRSTYSKLIPENATDTTSFFSFYDILEKIAVVLGTAIFGIIDQAMGMRNSFLMLALFFVIGIVILSKVKIQKN